MLLLWDRAEIKSKKKKTPQSQQGSHFLSIPQQKKNTLRRVRGWANNSSTISFATNNV